MASEQEKAEVYQCAQCRRDLTDPKNAGFPFEGEWYCSEYCAELGADFVTAGERVEDYNSQLKEGA